MRLFFLLSTVLLYLVGAVVLSTLALAQQVKLPRPPCESLLLHTDSSRKQLDDEVLQLRAILFDVHKALMVLDGAKETESVSFEHLLAHLRQKLAPVTSGAVPTDPPGEVSP